MEDLGPEMPLVLSPVSCGRAEEWGMRAWVASERFIWPGVRYKLI